jgi:hypothetical protein
VLRMRPPSSEATSTETSLALGSPHDPHVVFAIGEVHRLVPPSVEAG